MGTTERQGGQEKSAVCREWGGLEGAGADDTGAGRCRAGSNLQCQEGGEGTVYFFQLQRAPGFPIVLLCVMSSLNLSKGILLSHNSPDQVHFLDDKTHGYNGTQHLPRDLPLVHRLGGNGVDLALVSACLPLSSWWRGALTCGVKCSKHKPQGEGRSGSWTC